MAEWKDLEHKLNGSLTNAGLLEKKILVGFSGGVDSLALLHALSRIRSSKALLAAAYVHHGVSSTEAHAKYRNEAALFCEHFCREREITFLQLSPPPGDMTVRTSEEDLRKLRYACLEQARVEQDCDFLALGHHADDLLETRILRLIRGTGPQGIRAMSFHQGSILRPFLEIPKKDLLEYVHALRIKPFEDPSNDVAQPLRNWLRNEWLPELEKRSPGALQSLARSLQLLTESGAAGVDRSLDPIDVVFLEGPALSRLGLKGLSKVQQKQAIARFVFVQNKRDFTQGHVEEVLKRLDSSQNDITFRVGGLDWYVNAQQIGLLGE